MSLHSTTIIHSSTFDHHSQTILRDMPRTSPSSTATGRRIGDGGFGTSVCVHTLSTLPVADALHLAALTSFHLLVRSIVQPRCHSACTSSRTRHATVTGTACEPLSSPMARTNRRLSSFSTPPWTWRRAGGAASSLVRRAREGLALSLSTVLPFWSRSLCWTLSTGQDQECRACALAFPWAVAPFTQAWQHGVGDWPSHPWLMLFLKKKYCIMTDKFKRTGAKPFPPSN
jgi:hypothetical protein